GASRSGRARREPAGNTPDHTRVRRLQDYASAKPVGGCRGERRSLPPTSKNYCSGENEDGIRNLFSWASSESPPPGGGHTPFFRASSRMAMRWSMLLYAQTWMKRLA